MTDTTTNEAHRKLPVRDGSDRPASCCAGCCDEPDGNEAARDSSGRAVRTPDVADAFLGCCEPGCCL
jgi:hypothetical protein